MHGWLLYGVLQVNAYSDIIAIKESIHMYDFEIQSHKVCNHYTNSHNSSYSHQLHYLLIWPHMQCGHKQMQNGVVSTGTVQQK